LGEINFKNNFVAQAQSVFDAVVRMNTPVEHLPGNIRSLKSLESCFVKENDPRQLPIQKILHDTKETYKMRVNDALLLNENKLLTELMNL